MQTASEFWDRFRTLLDPKAILSRFTSTIPDLCICILSACQPHGCFCTNLGLEIYNIWIQHSLNNKFGSIFMFCACRNCNLINTTLSCNLVTGKHWIFFLSFPSPDYLNWNWSMYFNMLLKEVSLHDKSENIPIFCTETNISLALLCSLISCCWKTENTLSLIEDKIQEYCSLILKRFVSFHFFF